MDNIKLDLQKRVVRIDDGCYSHATLVGQLWTARVFPQQATGLQQKTAVTLYHFCSNRRQFREGATVNCLPNGLAGNLVANCLPCSESFSAKIMYASVIFAVIQELACPSVCNSAVSIPLQNILTTPGVRHRQPPITSGRGSIPRRKVAGVKPTAHIRFVSGFRTNVAAIPFSLYTASCHGEARSYPSLCVTDQTN